MSSLNQASITLPARRCGRCRHWLVALVICFLTPIPGHCFTWDYEPRVEVGAQYESNPTGATQSSREDDAYAGIFGASMRMSAETPISNASFTPRIQAGAYTGVPDASELNYLDYYLPLSAYRFSQRAQYRISGGYNKTSTRSFPSTDPNDPSGPSSDTPGVDEYQERWYISPGASFQLGKLDVLSASLSYDDIRFTNPTIYRLFYQAATGDLTWTHTLNLQHSVSASANVSTFQSDSPRSPLENDSVTYGLNVGYQYAWTESTSVGATIGTAKSDIKVKGLPVVNGLPCLDPQQNELVLCELKTDDKNFVGQLFFRQQTAETITTELSVSRSIQPNSDGAQVTLDIISAYISKEFAPLLTGTLGASYSHQEAVGGTSNGIVGQRFDREYFNFDAALIKKLNRTWQVRAGYAYYEEEQVGGFTNYTVPRHRINIFLQYTGLGKH